VYLNLIFSVFLNPVRSMLRLGRSILHPSVWNRSILFRSFSVISSRFSPSCPCSHSHALSTRRGVLRFLSHTPNDDEGSGEHDDDDEKNGDQTLVKDDEVDDYQDNVDYNDDDEEDIDLDVDVETEGISRESSVFDGPIMKDMLKMIEMEIKRFQAEEEEDEGGEEGRRNGERSKNGTKRMVDFQSKKGTKQSSSRKSRTLKAMKPHGSSFNGNGDGKDTDEKESVPRKVLLFPLYQRPVFPGVEARLVVHDPVFADQVQEAANKGERLGLFFVDDKFIQSAKKKSRYPNVTSIKHVHDVGM
jgi:hypothetical protein